MTVGVTVQIVQWGKTDLTVRAVESLKRSEYEGPLQILVYDNDSPGGPGPIADESDVFVARGDRNIGFGPAHNRLADEARYERLLILNNDTTLEPRALGRLVERMSMGDLPGAVSPAYRSFEGGVLEMGGFVGPAGDGWQMFRGARPPESFRRLGYRVAYGSAACLLVRTSDFRRLGGFDDRYAPAYYEDTDYCMKLRSEGRLTVVEPRALVFHYEGATAGREVSSGMKRHQVRNRSKFVERWSRVLASMSPVGEGGALTDLLAPEAPEHLRVLWIAPHLPRMDREAGHARIMAMIDALAQDGHKVAFWAEQCFDAGRYGPMLERAGVHWFGSQRSYRWTVQRPVDEGVNDLSNLLMLVPFDVVVVSFPELAGRLGKVVRSIRPEAAMVVDDVDLHFLRADRAAALGIEGASPISKEAELAVYAESDGVITASDTESEVLGTEIPGVPTWPFAVSAQPPRDAKIGATTLLFLGNFSHHPNRDAVDWWLAELGEEIERRLGRPLPLRVIGAGSERLAEVDVGGRLEIGGWVEHLDPELAQARCFLAPLRYGAGTKGKILAALSHGVPVVTTSIGAEGNPGPVLAGLLVADSVEGLAGHVVELWTSDEVYRQARDAARAAGSAAWDLQSALSIEFSAWVRRRVSDRRSKVGSPGPPPVAS